MTYERALEIIQTEEYLTAADIDLIHKKKKKKRSVTNNRAGNPTFPNIFSLFTRNPGIRAPFSSLASVMTRTPRFRFRDRPKPNPIIIQNVSNHSIPVNSKIAIYYIFENLD